MFLCFNLPLTAATAKPKMQESVSTNRERINGASNEKSAPATVISAFKNHTSTVGIITISSYINPIANTPNSRAIRIFAGGKGKDSSKSLSFA